MASHLNIKQRLKELIDWPYIMNEEIVAAGLASHPVPYIFSFPTDSTSQNKDILLRNLWSNPGKRK